MIFLEAENRVKENHTRKAGNPDSLQQLCKPVELAVWISSGDSEN